MRYKFGERIRKCREKKGMSQKELAEKVGVTVRTIRNWEEGKTSTQIRYLGELVRVFGLGLHGELRAKPE